MHSGLQVQYPLFLLDFSETWNFSTDFTKKKKKKNFMKICPVPCGRAGRTDSRDETDSRFSQFYERASNLVCFILSNRVSKLRNISSKMNLICV